MRWQDTTPKEILAKMIQEKLDPLYEQDNRPTHEDTFAEIILDISKDLFVFSTMLAR